MASIAIALQKLLDVCFEYSIVNRTVQDIYKSAILKFYFKLINNELPQYFDTFTPPFSMGSNHYNIDNPCRQLPKINNKFPKQSLRYKKNVVLNETDSNLILNAEKPPYINLNNSLKVI